MFTFRFMVFNGATVHFQQYFSYRGGQFYWWRKPEFPEKPLKYLYQNLTSDQNYIQVKQFHNRNQLVCLLLHIGSAKHILINQSRSNMFAVIQRQSQKMERKNTTHSEQLQYRYFIKSCVVVFCVFLLCVFTFLVPCCDVRLNILKKIHILNLFNVCIILYKSQPTII